MPFTATLGVMVAQRRDDQLHQCCRHTARRFSTSLIVIVLKRVQSTSHYCPGPALMKDADTKKNIEGFLLDGGFGIVGSDSLQKKGELTPCQF